MIGLEILINRKKKAQRASVGEKFSYRYISNLLGLTYAGVSKKCKNGNFTVTEAFAIFNSLVTEPNAKTLQFYEYLFTEQN